MNAFILSVSLLKLLTSNPLVSPKKIRSCAILCKNNDSRKTFINSIFDYYRPKSFKKSYKKNVKGAKKNYNVRSDLLRYGTAGLHEIINKFINKVFCCFQKYCGKTSDIGQAVASLRVVFNTAKKSCVPWLEELFGYKITTVPTECDSRDNTDRASLDNTNGPSQDYTEGPSQDNTEGPSQDNTEGPSQENREGASKNNTNGL